LNNKRPAHKAGRFYIKYAFFELIDIGQHCQYNEKNNKLLAVRDTICLFLSQSELSAEECREVLRMCEKEVDAADKRSKFGEVKKEED
jgi:hypothetical protein